MNLVSSFAPSTFLRPCLVISTLYTDKLKETAVAFVEALNGQHAMSVIYSKDEVSKKSEFIPIKQHKTMADAVKFHSGLAQKMRNGCSEEEWEKGLKPYLEIYDKFCPKEMKSD